MGGLTSAASFIALLDEEQPELKVFALEKLNSLVDEFWPEIASEIQKVYVHSCVYEGEMFMNCCFQWGIIRGWGIPT